MQKRWWAIALLSAAFFAFSAAIWWKVAFGLPERAHAAPLAGVALTVAETTRPVLCSGCEADSGEVGAFGKRAVETTAEWQRTPAAAVGKDCATCHADGVSEKTLDDTELIASAFHANAKFISDGEKLVGKLDLVATEVGHRLPTLAGTELVLQIVQLDAEKLELEGTRQEGIVGRRMSGTAELFDTRLLPGEAKSLLYEAKLSPEAAAVVARVSIHGASGARVVWEQREGWLVDE